MVPPLANRLLARLPATEYKRLARHLEPTPFPLKKVLYQAGAPLDYVYFPTRGIISAMTIMDNGNAIEVATIGNEGMLGLTACVGGATAPNDAMVQVEGAGLWMKAKVLQDEARKDGPLRETLALYHCAFQTQVSFSVACNGLHKIEQRCSRWLLMTRDRVGIDELPLTHEFLAIMLGVRRSSVTEVLLPLQRKKLIQNGRGKITILNRPQLEARSCECYRRIKEEFARLFGDA
jgi:CRP-like cAMP-binding protein